MARPVMLAGLLGAAVGVPYVVDQSDDWKVNWPATSNVSTEATPTSDIGGPLVPPDLPAIDGPGSHLYKSSAPLEGIPTFSLAEVLRMDVSQEWVYSRWARKSTGLAEPGLFGIRVPLVSGTRMTDVAGSLTYYFNRCGQLDKIRLVGKTADTRELVQLVSTRYGFRPAPPLVAGEQLYRYEQEGLVLGELRTQPESVLWTTSPHDSFSVNLEINRPGSGQYVKPPQPKLMAVDTPPTPPANLFGEQQPPGQPVFPGESVVPSTDSVPAQQASTQTEATEAAVPKKIPKPPLRWPN